MNVLIIDNGSKHIDELINCFANDKVKVLKYGKHTRIDQEWADMFVLSGGNKPVLFKRYFSNELNLIRDTKKPLIGICLGFELIAKAFGSKLKRHSRKTTGVKEIEILPEYFGLKEGKIFNVYEAHRWVLTDPNVLETVGFSSRGAEIIKHPTRRIIGFQFHPEVSRPENDGRLLFDITVELMGKN